MVINAVGDIMLSGSRNSFFARSGYDYPFAVTADILHNADVSVGNLENPVSYGGKEFKGKRFRFRGDPAMVSALQKAGFSLLTLANNHILDYGSSALQETIAQLDRCGISHVGAGKTVAEARQVKILNIKGKRVAFLAYSLTQPDEFYATATRPGTAPGFASYVTADIASARSMADYVIVSFHWGGEGESSARPYQISAAHKAIDAGADVVLGHHPHVLQGVERYRRGVILYSLGNFAFASMSRISATSMIARITLDDEKTDLEIIPINVLNSQVRFQPKPMYGKQGERVIEKLNRLSSALGSEISSSEGRYLLLDRTAAYASK